MRMRMRTSFAAQRAESLFFDNVPVDKIGIKVGSRRPKFPNL